MRCPIYLTLIGLAGAGIGLAAGPAPAAANCYETFGCTNSDYYKVAQLKQASCQILWEMHNQIYKENGAASTRSGQFRPSAMRAANMTMRATCR
jgi:hypothetical protein